MLGVLVRNNTGFLNGKLTHHFSEFASCLALLSNNFKVIQSQTITVKAQVHSKVSVFFGLL